MSFQKQICSIQSFAQSLNPLHKLHTVPDNIICVSLFIQQYDQKFISKYLNNCIFLFLNYKKFLPDFHLIVFTDNTIYKSPPLLDIIHQSDLNIIVYNCQQLIDSNTSEHKGLIGTLIRYFPLFSPEYSSTKQIIITDIDLNKYDFQNFISCIQYMHSNPKIQFFFKTTGVRFQNEWANQFYPQIISVTIISKRQFPPSIFDDFLHKITSNQKSKLRGVSKINHSRLLNLSYGIDEFFLNFHLMPWIINHSVFYGFYTLWDYKFIINNFTLNSADPYLDEKILFLSHLRKKDLSSLHSLLDQLLVPPHHDIFTRCSLINLDKPLSTNSISAINSFILSLRNDPYQRFFSPWQIQFILYNLHQKSSSVFFTLKKLSILHEQRFFIKGLFNKQLNFPLNYSF